MAGKLTQFIKRQDTMLDHTPIFGELHTLDNSRHDNWSKTYNLV